MPIFFLRTLGGLSLLRDGAPDDSVAPQRKALVLLAVIAASGDAGIARDRAMALLWPESDAERARGALKQMLHVLRRHLGTAEAIRGTAELRLDPALVETDVALFRTADRRGDLEEAVRLYTGAFLDGVYLDAAPEFERWLDAERAALARRHEEALERLAQTAAAESRHEEAVRWWRRLQEADRLSGQAAVGLMEALEATGKRAAALQHARVHELLLREELGTGPDPSVAALAERLRAAPPSTSAPVEHAAADQELTPTAPAGSDAPAERPRSRPASPPAAPVPPLHRTRWAVPLVAAAALLFAVLVAARSGSNAEPPLGAQRVAVGVFVNRTGDVGLDVVGTMAADWVTRGVARAGLAEVVDVGMLYLQGRDVAGAPAEPRRLAREHGAALVIAGNYYRSSDSLYFSASIVDVASGRVLRTLDPVGGSAADPLEAIDEVRQRIASALASVIDPSASTIPGARAHPPRFAAYEEFVTGQGVYWRGGFGESMAHFRRAAELDSSFSSAALWLGVAAVGVMRCDVADSVHLALAAQLDRLTEAERLTRQITAARCDTNPDEEHRLQRERASRSPGSSFHQWTVGMSARKARRPAEALAVLRTVDPRNDLGWLADPAFYWRELMGAQHALGDHRAEQKSAQRFASMAPPRLISAYLSARALAGAGRPAAALRALDGVERLPPDPVLVAGQISSGGVNVSRLATPGWVLYQTAAELLAHGHPAEAREAAARAAAWLQSRAPSEAAAPEHRWVYAQTLQLLGRHAEAVPVAAGLVAEDSSNIDYAGTLGVISASSGDTVAARTVDRWLSERPVAYPAGLPLLYRARIATALGEYDRALAFLDALPHGAHPQGEILLFHSDPALLPLRDLPRFRAFLRPRG